MYEANVRYSGWQNGVLARSGVSRLSEVAEPAHTWNGREPGPAQIGNSTALERVRGCEPDGWQRPPRSIPRPTIVTPTPSHGAEADPWKRPLSFGASTD